MIAGKTISLVKGLPEMVEKSAKEEKATAKGVNDHKKLLEEERYPIFLNMTSSLLFLTSNNFLANESSQAYCSKGKLDLSGNYIEVWRREVTYKFDRSNIT